MTTQPAALRAPRTAWSPISLRSLVKRISGRPLLGEFEFTLHHLDSHPVGRELGVQSQVTRLAFEIEMDFVLDDGQVLWQGTAS